MKEHLRWWERLGFSVGQVFVAIKPEIRDLWIGVYWNTDNWGDETKFLKEYSIYVCIVPCLPIRITWYRPVKEYEL
jgi:hypothetical protein